MERDIDKRQTVEEAAHLFAESRSSGSVFPAYYHGFIAGAEWTMKHKTLCLRDKDKVCNLCHECDVSVLNPSF